MGRLLALGAVLCAGCGSDSGEPVVEFSPIDCGRIGCNFDQRIAVGGVIGLQIRLAGGESTVGLDVRARDPAIVTITQIADVAGQPTWELEALRAGAVVLEAIDPPESEDEKEKILDKFEIETASIDAIGLVNFIGDASGPTAEDGYDEVWSVAADQAVSFRVTPFIGGEPTMGRFNYDVTLDPEILNGLIDSETREGRLHFIPPPGDLEASWADEFGRTLSVLIKAE